MKKITLPQRVCILIFLLLFPITSLIAQTSNVSVAVNWPNWASENRVEVYTPGGTMLAQIDNGYSGCCDDAYSTIVNLGCLADMNNYYIIMYDTFGDGWNGTDNITVTTSGTSVINQNGNGATPAGTTVFFNVTGGCGNCPNTVNTFPYNEDFETGLGVWTQDVGDHFDWTRHTGQTSSLPTGPLGASSGSWYLYTEATGNYNNTSLLESPCFDLTGTTAPQFNFDYHMYGANMGTLNVDISTDNGATYPANLWTQTGQVQTANGDPWNTVTLDLSPYAGQTVKLRFSGTTGSAYRSDIAIDKFSLTDTTPVTEINITGLGNSIPDGDTTPVTTDDTDWGSVNLGTPTVHTFTIQNLGTANLNLTAAVPYITVTGPNALEFVISAPPAPIIAPGGSTTFSITFTPAAIGIRTATLTIPNTDANENPYNFDIQGLGVSPAQEIDITGLGNSIVNNDATPSTTDDTEYGNVVVGGSSTHTFTIHNYGGVNNLNLTGGSPYVAIAGANPGDFAVTAIPTSPIGAGGSTTFDIRFTPATTGVRSATLIIANNDTNENPYTFAIRGTGVNLCATVVSTFPYVEDFETGIGSWTQDTGDNYDWTRHTGWTSSSNTGPVGAHSGAYYMYTEASTNYNNTGNLISPCFDLTGTVNPRVTVFYHMYGVNMGTLNMDISTDGGVTYPTSLISYTGEVQNAWNSSWIPVSFDLSAYVGQTVRVRVQGITGSSYRSDMAIDYFRLTEKAEPLTGPGGITADLGVWLKANGGLSLTDGQDAALWQDQGRGGDAYTQATGQEPTYHDNINDNVNFNPVLEFDNSFATFTLDTDFSHDRTTGDFMTSDFGFYTQDMFIVLIPDDTPITNSFGFMDVFCSDANRDSNVTDATGVGLGSYTARISGEIICYAHDSFTTGQSPPDGYAVAEAGTGSSYDNVGIINTMNNSANTQQELYYNGRDIETIQNDIPEYMNTNDARYWIGRSEGWESSLNGRVVEVISFKSRKNDVNLTQERNRINSYLAVKYGITLGVQGISQDYVDSHGTEIWDQSANAGFNYDIAGIGRDDNSALNQKQSSSINNAEDAIGPIEGIITVGLTDIYDTNNLNISNNTNTFNDLEFLMWGNNGVDLNSAEAPVGVNMSAGITPALVTNTSFTGMQRHWKFVETGGDVGLVKISIAQAAIRNINPPGEYLMLISDSPVFDPTATYRVMKPDGMGNLYCFYDFDGVKYITFGYAPQVIEVRSIKFDGITDYVDMEDQLDLNPASFTVSGWVKRETGSENSSILSKRDAAYTEGYDLIITGSGRLEMNWKNGSTQSITSDVAIPIDEWHHVAVIYNNGQATMYIDGVQAKTAALTPPPVTNQSFYMAAAGKNTPTAFYKGNLDEIRIWNTALTVDQLRFVMNQEMENNAGFVSGRELPTTITKNDVGSIPWSDLAAYYTMSIYTYTNVNDSSGNNVLGALRNLDTVDRQTAPLPYISDSNGDWTNTNTWLNNNVQYLPNSLSIVDGVTPVGWNIVETSHDITIDTYSNLGYERSVLGLTQSSGDIEIDGDTSAVTGNGLTVTHYLKMDGTIDLEGESQLIQTLGSDLDVTSAGTLERDQQGTADVYTYNYWAAPVGISNTTSNNNAYSLPDVMRDDTLNINWITTGYDGTDTSPIGLADYWIWKFANQLDDDYPSWQHVRSTGSLQAGEGFTMKGPGSGVVLDDQNYVFLGKPHNGDINLPLSAGNDYLVGNPYASAIDAQQFILDNGSIISGNGATTGTLYFWEHWGGGSHNLGEYLGGYATYNLSGGVPSAAQGTNDPDVGTGGTPTKTPGRYIPVGQGFFVVAEGTGTINFNNGQRIFQKEAGGNSIFMEANPGGNLTFVPGGSENNSGRSTTNDDDLSADPRTQLRIGFNSVNTIRRQLLLTIDPNATEGIDWGYDGELSEEQMDDLYWIIDSKKHIIQGSNNLDDTTSLPLGVLVNMDGMNSIALDSFTNNSSDLNVYVHDKELNIYHDLSDGEYEFYLTAGEHLERFDIVFSPGQLGTDDPEFSGMDIHYANDIDSIILINPTLKPIASIYMYDALGKTIYSEDAIPDSNYSEYKLSNLSTGTYILKINTRGGSFSKMVLVTE